jgi:hypothetical protein
MSCYWRLNYEEKSGKKQCYRLCMYNSAESFQEFVQRLCTKLSLEEKSVVPFKYKVKGPAGCLTIAVNDDEDYYILVTNMLNSESSKDNQGYELILL